MDEVMKDIHDIKPLEVLDFTFLWNRYGPYILVGLLIILVAIAIFIYIKKGKSKKGKSKKEQVAPPLLLPHEKALMLIEGLPEMGSIECKKYYFKVSLILRGYIHDRFGIDAIEMTSEELLPDIAKLEFHYALYHEIKSFILFADSVKFADKQADKETMGKDIYFLKSFIEKTKVNESKTEN